MMSRFQRTITSLLFGSSMLLLSTACGPEEDTNKKSSNTTQQDMGSTTDQGSGTTDQGGGTTDQGGGTIDQGGGTTDQGGGTTKDLSTVEKFNTAVSESVAGAFCRAIWECPDEAGFLLIAFGAAPTQADCAAALLEELGGEGFGGSMSGGRITYDASKANACYDAILASVQGPACGLLDLFEDDSDEPDACKDVIVGNVAEGSNCLGSEECAGDLSCDFDANEDLEQCYATCQPQPCGGLCNDNEYCEEGEPDVCVLRVDDGKECFDDEECKLGSECDLDTDLCVAVAAEPALTLGDTGAACNIQGDLWCKPGLACVDVQLPSFEGVCGPASLAAASCVFDFSCAAGLYCAGVDFSTLTPGACAAEKANGAACENDSECQTSCNEDSKTCGAPVVCVVP